MNGNQIVEALSSPPLKRDQARSLSPKCPSCGGTSFRCVDIVTTTCGVTFSRWPNGDVDIDPCAEGSVIHWDSSVEREVAKPYDCANCLRGFSDEDIVAASGGDAAPFVEPAFYVVAFGHAFYKSDDPRYPDSLLAAYIESDGSIGWAEACDVENYTDGEGPDGPYVGQMRRVCACLGVPYRGD